MVQITFIDAGGATQIVEAKPGQSLMEAAVKNAVAAIAADCGGACACATCRVHVDEAWRPLTGEPGAMEQSMLDFTDDPAPGARLSCQIKVTEALDGLVVTTPASQF